VVDHQDQLLSSWDVPISYLILVLQRSQISLTESSAEVTQEKDRLRAKFIRLGCNLIFALQDRGAKSDLFDPRTGYPLLASADRVLDDNAVVEAILGYSVISYQHCTLLTHPVWGNQVYPSIVATSGSLEVVELCVQQIIGESARQLKNQ
jgi:hypothetical protein